MLVPRPAKKREPFAMRLASIAEAGARLTDGKQKSRPTVSVAQFWIVLIAATKRASMPMRSPHSRRPRKLLDDSTHSAREIGQVRNRVWMQLGPRGSGTLVIDDTQFREIDEIPLATPGAK